MATHTISALITFVLLIFWNQSDLSEHCSDSRNIILIYHTISISVIVLLFIGLWTRPYYTHLKILFSAMLFSIFASQITLYFWGVYFFEKTECAQHSLAILVVVLQITQCLMVCINVRWFVLYILALSVYVLSYAEINHVMVQFLENEEEDLIISEHEINM
eukprot:189643_1